jgi:Domain of unknown function (DUF4342)
MAGFKRIHRCADHVYFGKGGQNMTAEKIRTQEFQVNGEDVIARLKSLVHEGNIRRITLKNEEGKTLLEIPLTVGVVGAVLLPVWAAVGALAALATKLTIVVEKIETEKTD